MIGQAGDKFGDDGAEEGRRVLRRGVGGQGRGEGDGVGKDVDFEVRLKDGGFNIEGGDFVS